jgi:hypothetical protein
VKIAP